ncbi:hypothetical protein E2C01_046512 [Portunus trituberculatus]|uniref:Uncharacterized protein n=1 Tax=Portunus trituberculatus TaxID=210409 RepID=A0A5B7G526_PORTR|nr:hypothetical protein [Portunus trituberculatus]
MQPHHATRHAVCSVSVTPRKQCVDVTVLVM